MIALDVWNLSLSGYFTPASLTASPSTFTLLLLGFDASTGFVFQRKVC